MRLFSFLHLRVSESNKHLLNNLFAVIPATPQSRRWLDSLHEANLFISIAIDFFLPSRCRDGGFPRPRHANFFLRDARLVLHHCGRPTQAGNQDETRLSATSMLWLPTTNPTISFEIRLTFPICSLTVSLNLGVLRFSAKQTFLFFIFFRSSRCRYAFPQGCPPSEWRVWWCIPLLFFPPRIFLCRGLCTWVIMKKWVK